MKHPKLTKKFVHSHPFLWDRKVLIKYLKTNPNIYLFGLSGNVFDTIDLFDKVYFLKVNPQVVVRRLMHSSRKNPWGKKEWQQKATIDYHSYYFLAI